MHEALLTLFLAMIMEGFAVAAVVTWIYDTSLLAELWNMLPRRTRPRFYLRKDMTEWLPGTRIPVWMQTLLTCSRCGTFHVAFWLGLAHVTWLWQKDEPFISVALLLLLWIGSAGLAMKIRREF